MQEAPDQESQSLLADSLSSTSLRHINVTGSGEMLLPILRGFAANTSTVDRTVMNVMFSLSLPCEWYRQIYGAKVICMLFKPFHSCY